MAENSKPDVAMRERTLTALIYVDPRPIRLRLPNFLNYPWESPHMRSSEVIRGLQIPFTVCKVFEPLNPFIA
jgi:hypothetical protein